MFWNVENFFDYVDGGMSESDKEFSSSGSRRWTKKKFHTKCDAVAKSLFWTAEEYGRMPDVVGLAEVENRGVLTRLLNNTLLRKQGYRVVHYDSPDRRGIDVALLYRESVFRKISSSVKVFVKSAFLSIRSISAFSFHASERRSADFFVPPVGLNVIS